MSHYTIHHMDAADVNIATNWAAKEGWNPGLNDAKSFYAADPHGFFIGKLHDQVIATASAIAYDDTFGFFGLYIVAPEYRQRGYGLQLTTACLDYLNDRCVGLDGVVNMVDRYERLDYKAAHENTRYCLKNIPTLPSHPQVSKITQAHFTDLCAYDRLHFPAPRINFLRAWLYQDNAHALVYIDKDNVAGYGVIRPCREGYRVGPLFANTAMIARALLETMCATVTSGPIYIDVPRPNQAALDLVQSYAMIPTFTTIRMYRHGFPQLRLANIFGITSLELG